MNEEKEEQTLQIGFDVVEVQKVNLGPGDILMVTIKNDDVSQASAKQLQEALEGLFPKNKIFVLCMGTNDDVKFSVATKEEAEYCQGCSGCDNKPSE